MKTNIHSFAALLLLGLAACTNDEANDPLADGPVPAQVTAAINQNLTRISVADDGKGFDRGKKSKGFGLRTIWQRAGSVGAAIELDTVPGKGVRLYVSVNIGKNDGQEHEG